MDKGDQFVFVTILGRAEVDIRLLASEYDSGVRKSKKWFMSCSYFFKYFRIIQEIWTVLSEAIGSVREFSKQALDTYLIILGCCVIYETRVASQGRQWNDGNTSWGITSILGLYHKPRHKSPHKKINRTTTEVAQLVYGYVTLVSVTFDECLFLQYSDSELWTVLDRCHLDKAVRKLGRSLVIANHTMSYSNLLHSSDKRSNNTHICL